MTKRILAAYTAISAVFLLYTPHALPVMDDWTILQIFDRARHSGFSRATLLLSDLIDNRWWAQFRIFCGLEALSLPMLVVGAKGLMNAVSNLAPMRVAALYNAVDQGDLKAARKLHDELFELNESIFLDTNPIPLKYMMNRLGLLDSSELRLPLVSIDAQQAPVLDSVLARAGLLQAAGSRAS